MVTPNGYTYPLDSELFPVDGRDPSSPSAIQLPPQAMSSDSLGHLSSGTFSAASMGTESHAFVSLAGDNAIPNPDAGVEEPSMPTLMPLDQSQNAEESREAIPGLRRVPPLDLPERAPKAGCMCGRLFGKCFTVLRER